MRAELISAPAADGMMPQGASLWIRLRDGLASVRLAIGLFFLIAVLATVGTIIPQDEPSERYLKEYGEIASWWLQAFGITHLFHAWWFTGLLALLCANSLTCFFKRFPAIWRSVLQDKTDVTLSFIRSLSHQNQVQVSTEGKAVARGIGTMLAKRGFQVSVGHNQGEITLFARKGIMGRIGSHIGHLSVAVILLGAFIGGAFGFREFGAGVEGETYYIARGDFHLRVDRFWMDYYETGAVKSYNSRLTVIDQGREVLAKTIKVNDPLVYKGVWFYQSSYGDAWNHIEQVQVRVSDKRTGRLLKDVVLDWQKETVLTDLGLKLAVTGFVADFAFNPHEKMVYSKSTVHRNPAVEITITEGNRPPGVRWLLFAFPDLVQVQESKYRFEPIGYTPKKFTGLQIAKDPGVGLVWAGSTMLVVGVTLSALIYHRRIWVKLWPSTTETSVVWGGTSHKSRIDFLREFDRISEDIKKGGG